MTGCNGGDLRVGGKTGARVSKNIHPGIKTTRDAIYHVLVSDSLSCTRLYLPSTVAMIGRLPWGFDAHYDPVGVNERRMWNAQWRELEREADC